ncbi:MAG: LAGLIDADG family homing endonuclease, partial [Candidatus Paceibacterota bacterium]
EQRTPKIPRLSDLRESGCLTGDTLITLADTGERKTIKELAERQEQNPLNILSLQEDFKVKPSLMTKAFYSGKKKVFELKTQSGRKIKASGNHPFFKLEGWKRLDELKIDDFVALPRSIDIQTPQNELSDDELVLLAHLLGDGCILPKQPFHYTNAYEESIETVRRSAEKLFDIKGRIVKQENWYHIYLTSPFRLSKNRHHPITDWFKKLGIGLVRSYEKKIPEAVFSCDKTKIALFLRNLWSTDGNLSWKKLKGRIPAGNIYYSTSSEEMAGQIQHLLLTLGIQSSISLFKKQGYRNVYGVRVQGSENQLKFLKLIGIADRRQKIIPEMVKSLVSAIPNPNNDIIPKEVWKLVIDPIREESLVSWRELSNRMNTSYCGTTLLKSGVSRQRMVRLCNALENEKLNQLADSGIYWDKIISIKELGIEDVYDATVEGTHNFVANDIIVHNSLEQDADVVLLIYREDAYREDTPRKGISDIIIAKHRNGPVGRVELFFDKQRASFRNLETGLNFQGEGEIDF